MTPRIRKPHSIGLIAFSACFACANVSSERDGESDSATSGDGDDQSGDGDRGEHSGDGDISLGNGDHSGDVDEPSDCQPRVVGLLRDFRAGGDLTKCPVNGDFQNSWQNPVPDVGWVEPGIAAATLGTDKKPVFSGGTFTTVTSAATFDAWYRDDPACNQTFEHEIEMIQDPSTDNLVFDSAAFFPLDGRGFGNSGAEESGVEHNFHFTFELHMTFVYRGGEVFSFTGDDDLFVFIDDELALDLGGVHAPQEGEVILDDFGLDVGEEYPIDFFHAERSTSQSNFHIETSLEFSNCEPIFVVK